ncbi:hypothetical protein GCM10010231_62930 [Streptomyces sindenensis]|nr:hypothetical protein GCM10010231_62930 [Streptomyces sindenensis]
MVVAGPGQRVRFGRVRRAGPRAAQALRRPVLLADHQLQPVDQLLAPAGPPVVRGGGRGVQRGGPDRDLLGEPGAVQGREVREQGLHHVPGRNLHPFEAGPHTRRVAPGEDPVPTPPGVQARHQIPQVLRERPYFVSLLMHRHRRPRRPPTVDWSLTVRRHSTAVVLRGGYAQLSGTLRRERGRRAARPRAQQAQKAQ